jgi:spore maturation protein CgeB
VKLVIFGLTISSSWGNGHATLWRGLCRALRARGHDIVFFEKDAPYYRQHRDLPLPSYARLVLYEHFADIQGVARGELADADVGVVTSYCPDGVPASELVIGSPCQVTCFYDLDTPITLAAL